jgi:hypothetical protein
MNSLKELINKVYSELNKSDWIIQYPELSDINLLSEYLQDLTLEMIPEAVDKKRLEDFVTESETNYKESTFKKYISDYSSFLDNVETEFYNSLLLSLAD